MGMLLGATLFWALSFPVMKSLYLEQQKLLPGAGTWFLTAVGVMYRFGAAGLLLALYLGRNLQKMSRLELEQGIGLGVFGVGGILLQVDGLAYTAASTSAFLTQFYCIIIPLWVAITKRTLPSKKTLLSIVLVVLGMIVLAGLNFRELRIGRGEAETLIGSFMFAGQMLWLERPRYAANDPLRFSAVMFLVMALVCLPGVWITAPNTEACLRAFVSPAAIGFLVTLVVVCTLGGYLFMNRWQRDVTATEAGIIYCVEPVIASALALFLPAWISIWADISYSNETLTPRLLIGGGLITVANVLLQKR